MLKESLDKSKAKTTVVDKSRMEAKSSIKDQIKAAIMKVVESFWALEELHEEKIQFTYDAYHTKK